MFRFVFPLFAGINHYGNDNPVLETGFPRGNLFFGGGFLWRRFLVKRGGSVLEKFFLSSVEQGWPPGQFVA
ncbi:MAG: hypothetical protein C4527_19640 [Candidatus Omnitrophota bacterium]|jgi:hypothetical protein|nr:MAG: hypothetical protein C4527_19640 [Candidatus Omnitrophota bacterium]